MLILGRKLGEAIKIGDNITVHILGQQGKHIRVGIAAPPHIPVYREEIHQRIQQNKLKEKAPDEAA